MVDNIRDKYMKDMIRVYKDNLKTIQKSFGKAIFNSAIPLPSRLYAYKVAEKVEKQNRDVYNKERSIHAKRKDIVVVS